MFILWVHVCVFILFSCFKTNLSAHAKHRKNFEWPNYIQNKSFKHMGKTYQDINYFDGWHELCNNNVQDVPPLIGVFLAIRKGTTNCL